MIAHETRRTTIDLDVTELEAAKKNLGTGTTSDTVNAALREVNRRAALARAAAFVEQGKLEVVTPEELGRLRAAP